MSSPRQILSALLCALALLALATACSIERNYRALSFFFDGVPDPNAPEEEDQDPQPRIDFREMTGAERAQFLAKRVEAPRVFIHKPVEDRQCDSCHVFPARGSQQSSWMTGIPKLRYPITELCVSCHERPTGAFVHGPAGAGQCAECHAAHQSRFPHLLRTKRVESRCRSCHQGEFFGTEEEHTAYEGTDCSVCHDPHSADNGKLLRPDWETLWRDARSEEVQEKG